MRLMEITMPNGIRVTITDKSDPRNVQMFNKVAESMNKGK
jgi:hypothetical protein